MNFIDDTYYLHSFVLETIKVKAPHTGEVTAKAIREVLEEYNLTSIKNRYFTTD